MMAYKRAIFENVTPLNPMITELNVTIASQDLRMISANLNMRLDAAAPPNPCSSRSLDEEPVRRRLRVRMVRVLDSFAALGTIPPEEVIAEAEVEVLEGQPFMLSMVGIDDLALTSGIAMIYALIAELEEEVVLKSASPSLVSVIQIPMVQQL